MNVMMIILTKPHNKNLNCHQWPSDPPHQCLETVYCPPGTTSPTGKQCATLFQRDPDNKVGNIDTVYMYTSSV